MKTSLLLLLLLMLIINYHSTFAVQIKILTFPFEHFCYLRL